MAGEELKVNAVRTLQQRKSRVTRPVGGTGGSDGAAWSALSLGFQLADMLALSGKNLLGVGVGGSGFNCSCSVMGLLCHMISLGPLE